MGYYCLSARLVTYEFDVLVKIAVVVRLKGNGMKEDRFAGPLPL
jgi:hypothetical protein